MSDFIKIEAVIQTSLHIDIVVPYEGKYHLTPARLQAFYGKIDTMIQNEFIPFTKALRFEGEVE